jgi:hypothetical protein
MLDVIRVFTKQERATAGALDGRHALLWHSTLNPPQAGSLRHFRILPVIHTTFTT